MKQKKDWWIKTTISLPLGLGSREQLHLIRFSAIWTPCTSKVKLFFIPSIKSRFCLNDALVVTKIVSYAPSPAPRSSLLHPHHQHQLHQGFPFLSTASVLVPSSGSPPPTDFCIIIEICIITMIRKLVEFLHHVTADENPEPSQAWDPSVLWGNIRSTHHSSPPSSEHHILHTPRARLHAGSPFR